MQGSTDPFRALDISLSMKKIMTTSRFWRPTKLKRCAHEPTDGQPGSFWYMILRVKLGARVIVGLMLAVCTGLLACAPANALNYGPSPEELCGMETGANQVVERETRLLSPAEGATVTVGESVTFTGETGSEPLRFMVASSPELLSTPDIDGGMGEAQAGGGGKYAFTSTKATATARTIYWAASFTRTLKGCEGPPVTFTTPPRTLIVAPPLVSPATSSPHLRVAVVHVSTHVAPGASKATIIYDVTCSISCTGSATVAAWARLGRHSAVLVPKLGLAPMRVNITSVSAGSEQITFRYRGQALRRLQRVLQRGTSLELRVSVQASNPHTGLARARCSTKLQLSSSGR
jgi:hypothetical protein